MNEGGVTVKFGVISSTIIVLVILATQAPAVAVMVSVFRPGVT